VSDDGQWAGGEASRRVRARVESLRRARGLTWRELSARLADVGYPMSIQTLSKISNGQRRVGVDDLVALAAALGVEPGDLVAPVSACSTCGQTLPS
jgi:transcriptional regulator with XRE-family HTH domain